MKKVLYFFIFGLSFSAVNDIDGNTYETVRIGNQLWMKENLKVTHFSNGDEILTNIPPNEWVDGSFSGCAYTLYNNDDIYFITYGNLYSWYAVNDSRGICMDGWRVPSDDDWKELETYLGMSTAEVNDVGNRGLDEGAKLKESGYSHWIETSECYNDQLGAVECIEATNETEFTAVPNGYCFGHTYGCESLGSSSHFWSSTNSETTDTGDEKAWSRILNKYSAQIDRYSAKKNYAFAVRCVQDVVEGCMDMNACNYDPESTEDDGSCEYPEQNFDCEGNCLYEFDECGLCNGDGWNADVNIFYCDCEGSYFDCSGICGGEDYSCTVMQQSGPTIVYDNNDCVGPPLTQAPGVCISPFAGLGGALILSGNDCYNADGFWYDQEACINLMDNDNLTTESDCVNSNGIWENNRCRVLTNMDLNNYDECLCGTEGIMDYQLNQCIEGEFQNSNYWLDPLENVFFEAIEHDYERSMLYFYSDGTVWSTSKQNCANAEPMCIILMGAYVINDDSIIISLDESFPGAPVEVYEGNIDMDDEGNWLSITSYLLSEEAFQAPFSNLCLSTTFNSFNLPTSGDVTMDGIIDILDAVRLIAIIMENWVPNEAEFFLADINNDGLIDILDAIEIVNIIIS